MSQDLQHARGETIGPYRLEEPLGRGGFSEVWRARDGEKVVALKVLLHPEHVAQLRQEANALALVRGPGIVPILGVALDHEPPYIALGLVPGGDLRSRIRQSIWTAPITTIGAPAQKRLPPGLALEVFESLLTVLGRVHAEGIVHGDLKPENLLFDERERLLVGDFGLSRRISQRSASLSVSLSLDDVRIAGTLDYMAPEQRAGEKPSTRSDVYAAGVILFEMLTGERPQGVFHMPSRLDRRIPPVVDRVIACALAEDPRNRFADAKAMLAYHRAGMASDWKELADFHQSVGRALVWRREVLLFVFVLFGLGLVGTGSMVFALDDLGLRDQSFREAVGGAIGFGLGFAFYVAALVWFRRRSREFARVRSTIEEQIGHEDGPRGSARRRLDRSLPESGATGCWRCALVLLIPIAVTVAGVLHEWRGTPPEQKAVNRANGQWVSHTGVVVDASGKPVAGATVYLDDTKVLTNADGRFIFGRVSAGSHRLWAQSGALVSARAFHSTLGTKFKERLDVKLTVVATGSIRGRVSPVPEASRWLDLLPTRERVLVGQGQESFAFPAVVPGRYAISFQDRLTIFEVVTGQETVVAVDGTPAPPPPGPQRRR